MTKNKNQTKIKELNMTFNISNLDKYLLVFNKKINTIIT